MPVITERPIGRQPIKTSERSKYPSIPTKAIIWAQGERRVISIGATESPFSKTEEFFRDIREQVDTRSVVRKVVQERNRHTT